MKSYTITAAAIEHYADSPAQFEHLLGRLTHEEPQRVTHGELEAMVQVEGGELRSGQCLPAGCRAQPAAGQVLARTA
jgi:hypothetical protein